jgi:glycine/D-amino acid oxidase-like deaminating enzyme/nitrite reductase/ring-hydroxylating ferredoxin subunit
MDDQPLPSRSRLEGHENADVCVVGAGIAGLSTAYELAREGRSVIVLEDGAIGSGETSRTTAHLSNAFDDRYAVVERLHGELGARYVAQSHTAAIDEIERIVREEGIACDFERLNGYLFAPPGDTYEILEREIDACRRAGLVDVEWADRAPFQELDTGRCLRFPRQAQLHALRYLKGLAEAFEGLGGRIFTNTHVESIENDDERRLVRVQAGDGGGVTAEHVVVATNTPVNDMLKVHTKQYAYRTFVIGAPMRIGSATKALYWDTAEPYHYARLVPNGDGEATLIVGGEDHKTGQRDDAEERYARLEVWARERFPGMGEITYRWSGQVMEPMDAVAFIGRNPGDERIWVATGDSGNGMTHGAIAGMLLRDLILGRDQPWARLYDPSRKTLRAAGEFTRENLNMAAQYADWVKGGDTDREDDILPGRGAVIRRGLQKLAAYRDPDGTLHRCSAVCPHLGGIVRWNSEERTWDCPAHGSRFDALGRVLNGPANSDLEAAETHEREKAARKRPAHRKAGRRAATGKPAGRIRPEEDEWR